MAKQPAHVYQLKVTLNDTRPPVWRRVLVPGDTTLRKLHDILQVVMGWTDSHLHQFVIGGAYYGATEYDDEGDLELLPEQRYRLSQVAPQPGARFVYEYDFGDGWDHTVLVEKNAPPEPGARYPRCVAGKRACPPEDVGGVWGYEEFLKAIRSPRHPEHDEYLTWVGGQFDPEAFDLDQVNAQLRGMGRGPSAEVGNTWAMIADALDEGELDLDSAWARTLSAPDRATAENLPLRRDVLALLAYLQDQRVTGTQATGNLPLKAVRAVCALFVDPPKLEDTIGDQVFQVRSETEVWPLYFRHVLAAVAGLLSGGPARRWRLTEPGEQFLAAPDAAQVWLLFAAWWTRVNWLIAFPWAYGGGQLPYGFAGLTLKHLLALPAGTRAPFEPFADRVIQAAPLVWPIENQETAHTILQSLLERVVIGPLADFGVLAAEYGSNPVLGPGYQKLVAFQLTPFGQGLLGAIREVSRRTPAMSEYQYHEWQTVGSWRSSSTIRLNFAPKYGRWRRNTPRGQHSSSAGTSAGGCRGDVQEIVRPYYYNWMVYNPGDHVLQPRARTGVSGWAANAHPSHPRASRPPVWPAAGGQDCFGAALGRTHRPPLNLLGRRARAGGLAAP